MSKHLSPHVTSFVEVDMTSAVLWIDKVKNKLLKKYKKKITFTPLFINAVSKAINDYQMIHDSFPHSFTIIWDDCYFPEHIINAYTKLLSLTQELLHIINLIWLEPLDAIFIQTRMEDPEDKDLDILVNRIKTLIFKRKKELETILHTLEHEYRDGKLVVHPILFKAKQQKGNPINHILKEIHQEIALLVKIFAQAQKE